MKKIIQRYIDIVREQKHPLRFIVSRFLRYTGAWRFFFIKKDGYVLRLHPASLSMSLWVNQCDRSVDSSVIKGILYPGAVYIDVGANVGHLAIEASRVVGDKGRVYAFEAHPKTSMYLRENVSINVVSNIFISQCAVGEEFGWVWFSDKRSDDQNKIDCFNGGIPVQKIRLYEYVKDLNIDLLKIDVEGFELYVLKGLGDAIDKVSNIYFEVLESSYMEYGYRYSDIHDYLTRKGFSIGLIKEGEIIDIGINDRFVDGTNLIAYRNLDLLLDKLPFLRKKRC